MKSIKTPQSQSLKLSNKAGLRKHFVIIASETHPDITQALITGAVKTLKSHGANPGSIKLLWAPGAFELPVVASRAAASRRRPHAIIALGAVIRGETRQYEVIANAVAEGLSQVAVSEKLPVTFGVIVAETPAQAKARSADNAANRGAEAALAALSVLSLFERIKV